MGSGDSTGTSRRATSTSLGPQVVGSNSGLDSRVNHRSRHGPNTVLRHDTGLDVSSQERHIGSTCAMRRPGCDRAADILSQTLRLLRFGLGNPAYRGDNRSFGILLHHFGAHDPDQCRRFDASLFYDALENQAPYQSEILRVQIVLLRQQNCVGLFPFADGPRATSSAVKAFRVHRKVPSLTACAARRREKDAPSEPSVMCSGRYGRSHPLPVHLSRCFAIGLVMSAFLWIGGSK